jgi:YD repeat-containing protein
VSKIYIKLAIWLVLLALMAAAAWGAVAGAANLLAYFERGANPVSALNIVPNVPPDLKVKLSWHPDDPDTGRKLEPLSRTQIESAYLRAWLQINLSYVRNEPYGLKTYFVGPALAAINDTLQTSAAQGWRIAQSDTRHDLQLHFYSADGAIVAFTDHDARVSQMIRDASGKVVSAGDLRASYSVVMMLEDGNWRIRHWVRGPDEPVAAMPAATAAPVPAGCVERAGAELKLAGRPFRVAGINYYPQASAWDRFWAQYDPAVVDHDFALIQTLGLNTIRTFVPFEQFGGAHVDAAMLTKLDDLLSRANAHGLKVIVTLFDFRADYNILLWPDADRHLETLLAHYADNCALLAWDLKNEPDLDYASAGRETVDAWLSHIAREAHTLDPNHAITIGWSTPAAARSLVDAVDLVTFHFFTPADGLAAQYAALRAAAPERPILMSEFGLPTWNSFFFPNGHSEPEQAAYYADLLATLRTTDSAGSVAWTLYDFTYVPAAVVGHAPWKTAPQRHLGVIRTDGTPKPAAALLAPNAPLDVPHPPAWARVLKPFWITVVLALVGTIVLATRRRQLVRVLRWTLGRRAHSA